MDEHVPCDAPLGPCRLVEFCNAPLIAFTAVAVPSSLTSVLIVGPMICGGVVTEGGVALPPMTLFAMFVTGPTRPAQALAEPGPVGPLTANVSVTAAAGTLPADDPGCELSATVPPEMNTPTHSGVAGFVDVQPVAPVASVV